MGGERQVLKLFVCGGLSRFPAAATLDGVSLFVGWGGSGGAEGGGAGGGGVCSFRCVREGGLPFPLARKYDEVVSENGRVRVRFAMLSNMDK